MTALQPPMPRTVNNHPAIPISLTPATFGAMPVGDTMPVRQPDTKPKWWRDGDTLIRLLTAVVVLAVAAFAAIVSYSHIYDLGRQHGQDGTAARLLPLSVDGLIASASLVMLHAARNRRDVPGLARLMLVLGVAATVGANVAYGIPFGPLGAGVSAWPAIAFVGSVEMAIKFVRDARLPVTDSTAADDAKPDRDPRWRWPWRRRVTPDRDPRWRWPWRRRVKPTVTPEKSATDTKPDRRRTDDRDRRKPPERPKPPKRPEQKPPRRPLTSPLSGRERAAKVLAENPGLTTAEAAQLAEVSERTVERAKADASKVAR